MAKVNFGESPATCEFDLTTVGNFSRFRENMVSELEKMASQLDTLNEGSRTAAFQSVVNRLPSIADGMKFYRIQLESKMSVDIPALHCVLIRYNHIESNMRRIANLLQFIPRSAPSNMSDDAVRREGHGKRFQEQLGIVRKKLQRYPYLYKQLRKSVGMFAMQVGRLTLSNDKEFQDVLAFIKDYRTMNEDKTNRRSSFVAIGNEAKRWDEVNEL